LTTLPGLRYSLGHRKGSFKNPILELRKPIFAVVNGIAYGGGSEIAQSTDFIIAF